MTAPGRVGADADLRVCAVIPAFNEAEHIGAVVRGIRPLVSSVVVVDDGSSDATADEARAAGAEIIRFETNRGKGHALRAGIEAALRTPCTHLLLLDGDGQHRPEDAPALLAAAATGADLVVGERQFRREDMPRSRYHANIIGSRALSWFVGQDVRDTQSGYRVVRADAIRPVRLSASGYEIETEMLIRLAQRGARITGTPVAAVYGQRPSRLRPVRDTTRTCLLAVKYRFLSRG